MSWEERFTKDSVVVFDNPKEHRQALHNKLAYVRDYNYMMRMLQVELVVEHPDFSGWIICDMGEVSIVILDEKPNE